MYAQRQNWCKDFIRILRGLERAPSVVERTPIIHILSCLLLLLHLPPLLLFNLSNVLIIYPPTVPGGAERSLAFCHDSHQPTNWEYAKYSRCTENILNIPDLGEKIFYAHFVFSHPPTSLVGTQWKYLRCPKSALCYVSGNTTFWKDHQQPHNTKLL